MDNYEYALQYKEDGEWKQSSKVEKDWYSTLAEVLYAISEEARIAGEFRNDDMKYRLAKRPIETEREMLQ